MLLIDGDDDLSSVPFNEDLGDDKGERK